MDYFQKKHNISLFSILITTSLITIFLSLFVGRYNINYNELIDFVISFDTNDSTNSSKMGIIILNMRLSRILSAFFVGGALSITGAAFQGMFSKSDGISLHFRSFRGIRIWSIGGNYFRI